MKKLLTLSMFAAAFALMALNAEAGGREKITVSYYEHSIGIRVANTEYVSDPKTPDKLKAVRFWQGDDAVLLDLTSEGADYTCAHNRTPAEDKKMKPAEAAAKWAAHVANFETLRKQVIEVRIMK